MFKVTLASVLVFNVFTFLGACAVMKLDLTGVPAFSVGAIATFIALAAATLAANIVDEEFN